MSTGKLSFQFSMGQFSVWVYHASTIALGPVRLADSRPGTIPGLLD